MKKEQEINNQWRILHKIFNNQKEIFDWDDMRQAIEALIKMKMAIALHVPLVEESYRGENMK